MSSDSRWTGGIANREWQSGTRQPEAAPERGVIEVHVKRYLNDCRRFHLTPSEGMALKVIFCRGDRQKQAVLTVFRQAVARG